MNRNRKLLFSVLIVVLSFFVVQVCQAILGVSPYRIDLDISYGETATRTVVVKNSSDEEKLIEVSLHGARSTPTGNPIWLTPQGENQTGKVYEYGAIGSLIEVEPKEAKVAANSSVEFTVKIKAPKKYTNGSFAGRVGGIFFKAVPIEQEKESESLIRHAFQVVTLVLIRFNSHQNPQAELWGTGVRQQEEGKLRFNAMIENTGNVHLYPKGKIIIRSVDTNEKVAQLEFSTGTSLPKFVRYYYADWDYPEGLSGTYEATYFITYIGDQGPELTSTIIFEMSEGKLTHFERS